MATLPRSSVIHVAQEPASIPLPERVTIGLAAFNETVREGLLAFCVGVGLSVVGEIFEEEITQLVGPRASTTRSGRAIDAGSRTCSRTSPSVQAEPGLPATVGRPPPASPAHSHRRGRRPPRRRTRHRRPALNDASVTSATLHTS
jgi:hypothetical protein